jgi:hypothetical protein
MKRAFKISLMAAAITTATATPAKADTTNGYGVNTAATAGSYETGYNAVSTYRTVTDAALAYSLTADWAPGFPATQQFSNCPGNSAGYSCTGTTSGTSSTNNNLLFSQNSAAFSDNAGRSSASTTYADLANRRLGVETVSTYGAGAFGWSKWADRYTLNVQGADASTVTSVTILWEFDGALFAPCCSQFTMSQVFAGINVNGAWAQAVYRDRANIPTVPGGADESYFIAPYWDSFTWDLQTPGLTRATAKLNVLGANPFLDVSSFLSTYSEFGGESRYLSTSRFSLILPSNVTYTTASGVGLAPVNGVPEPATWAMMLAGFGAVGSAMRRRARVSVTYA